MRNRKCAKPNYFSHTCHTVSALSTRDGPKFGERRSSAEQFGRMFGSATCDYSAEVRPNFGKNSASLAALLSRYFAVPPALT